MALFGQLLGDTGEEQSFGLCIRILVITVYVSYCNICPVSMFFNISDSCGSVLITLAEAEKEVASLVAEGEIHTS